MEYKQRPGTSGIGGHLYEIKLIGLILYRLLHDDRVKSFHLASNMNEMGAFDDICVELNIEDQDRPVVLFIQVKHKDNDNEVLKLDMKDRIKYFDSFLKIITKVTSQKASDKLFSGNISEADCVFIIYTNARFGLDPNTKFICHHRHVSTLNNLLNTNSGAAGCWSHFSEQDFVENCWMLLAEHFVTFICNKNKSMNVINDEYIQQYHVILKQKVVDLTEIKTDEVNPNLKWRTMTFRKDFFTNTDKYIAVFRDHLLAEVLKKYPKIRSTKESCEGSTSQDSMTPEFSVDDLISSFLSKPGVATLTPLIGTHITCNDHGKLKFLIKRSASDKEQLAEIYISQLTIDEAVHAAKMTAKDYLLSLKLNVPIAFGNVDIIVSGNTKRIERRLNYLAQAIVNLCSLFESNKIVTIDENNLSDGLLSYNGGLASAVGNIFVYDGKTKMLMLTDDPTSLRLNAKALYSKLKNLHEYRFHVKTAKFPKLHLDTTIAGEFLSKFIIYANQLNHYKVEKMLKEEIQERLNTNKNHCLLNSHSVFLHYQNEILSWWMSPKKTLTKECNLYKDAINIIEAEPQISALQTGFYMYYSKYFEYSFNENITHWMELPNLPSKIFIITNTIALTTVKVIKCLWNHYSINQYAVLDLKWMLNLSTPDFCSLYAELRKTKKALIILWHDTNYKKIPNIRLNELSQATGEKQLIIIANKVYKEEVQFFFSYANVIIEDETQNLTAMTLKSQMKVIREAKVIFQGQNVSLDLIMDNVLFLSKFIKGVVLDKMISNEIINVGMSLSDLRYEDIKHLYIDRRVSAVRDPTNDTLDDDDFGSLSDNADDSEVSYYIVVDKYVRTFKDIEDDVVLITAEPGMGKSTLVTHLALQTKDRDMKLWIVRFNFFDHWKQFHKWHETKSVIDPVQSLIFLCQVALKKEGISISIEIINDDAHLVSCTGDELYTFELNMFLNFYNKKRVIFVCDGFDEIYPYYKDTVLDFLKVAQTCLRKRKIWVTSRPYNDILPDLQKVLGKGYKIEVLSESDQKMYLERFWRKNIIFDKLNNQQHSNLQHLIRYMQPSNKLQYDWIHSICYWFLDFILPHLYNDRDNEIVNLIFHYLLTMYRVDKRPFRLNKVSGIPLHLYLVADYLANRVNFAENGNECDLEINKDKLYEVLIEHKLKKILFRAKNDTELGDPNIRRALEKDLANCISTYKRIAGYVLLRPIFEWLNLEEIENMNPCKELGIAEFNSLLKNITKGTENTWLISYVTTDNVPVFIHRTFLEYFAAGYICDVLKSDKFNLYQKSLFYYTVVKHFHHFGFEEWIDSKRYTDQELERVVRDLEEKEPRPLYNTQYDTHFFHGLMSVSQYIRLRCSTIDDYEIGCLDTFIQYKSINTYTPLQINKILRDFFSKMKPHLKHFFLSHSGFLVDESEHITHSHTHS